MRTRPKPCFGLWKKSTLILVALTPWGCTVQSDWEECLESPHLQHIQHSGGKSSTFDSNKLKETEGWSFGKADRFFNSLDTLFRSFRIIESRFVLFFNTNLASQLVCKNYKFLVLWKCTRYQKAHDEEPSNWYVVPCTNTVQTLRRQWIMLLLEQYL